MTGVTLIAANAVALLAMALSLAVLRRALALLRLAADHTSGLQGRGMGG